MKAAAPLILVVDDFLDNRQMYVEYLEFSGLRVEEAENGHEALEKAFALRPDLIVMDLSLPGIDGWEATRQLKADPATHHIPVIAITGHASELASRDAKSAGCASFVLKPALPDAVVAEIRKALQTV
jgi:two-component system, cell cycle response regulator DivK